MFKIKIIDRYIFSQVFKATLVCILLFGIIWIAPETLKNTVERVMNGQYTLEFGINVILCEIPKILSNALSVGVFLGTLFTFDKLSKDSEMTILRACGASFYRIIASLLLFGVLTSGLVFFVRDRLIPFTECTYSMKRKASTKVTHFVFPTKDKNDKMEKIIIVPEFVNYSINDVVVLDFNTEIEKKGGSLLKTIKMADYVKFNEKDNSWRINNATVYNISKDGVYHEVGKESNTLILDGERGRNAYELMKSSVKRDREMTNAELKRYISLLKQESMDDEYRSMLNKYLSRHSQVLMTILFVVFGALLGFSKPREQRLVGFTLAVLTIFLYYITMPFLDLMAEKGVIPPVITAFIAPIILLISIKVLKKHKDL